MHQLIAYFCLIHSLKRINDVAVQAVKHNEYETLAQSVCTSMAVSKGLKGWTYAVRRVCSGSVTCDKMCASKFLHVQDR